LEKLRSQSEALEHFWRWRSPELCFGIPPIPQQERNEWARKRVGKAKNALDGRKTISIRLRRAQRDGFLGQKMGKNGRLRLLIG
jgi:hypothetical protein